MKNNNGFTLIELLIAMTLTSIIGMILFSTYDMVMQLGKDSKEIVFTKEKERIFVSVLDNDFANLLIVHNERVPFYKDRQELTERFYQLLEMEQAEDNDSLIVSFQSTFSLYADDKETLPMPNIIEYVLRKRKDSHILVRRERAYAGLDVLTEWHEMILDTNIRKMEFTVLYKGKYVDDWDKLFEDDRDFYPEAIKIEIQYNQRDKIFSLVVPIPERERKQ